MSEDLLDLVKDRLIARAPALTSVEVVDNVDSISRGTALGTGAAIIAPLRDSADENALITAFRQLVHVEFVVAVVIRISDDSKGSARVAAYREFKRQIEAALAGWQPTDEADPIALVGGQGGRISANVSVYAQTWETTRFLTGTEE